MKRIISLLSACMLLFCLTACGSAHRLDSSYKGRVEFTDGSLSCTGDLTADGDTLTLSITSPENLSGISYEYRGGELHTTLNGLECVIPADGLPASAIPTLLHELFARSDEAEYQCTDDGADTFLLHTDAGDMTVTAKDGVPSSLTFGSRTVRFT